MVLTSDIVVADELRRQVLSHEANVSAIKYAEYVE